MSIEVRNLNKAFGKTISEHQAIAFKLADMKARMEILRGSL